MRKLILTSIILFVFSIASYGQIEKGNVLLGSTGSMSFSSNEERSYFDVHINPNLGYFVTNKIALIASIPLSFNTHKFETWQSTSIAYGLAPSLRYYFLRKDKSALFASTGFGLVQYKSKQKSSNPSNVTKKTSINTSTHISVGYVYFLSKSIGLEAELGYYRNKREDFKAVSNMQLNLGFQIYFGRGAKKQKE
jgi:hypothetical protein